MLDPTRCKRLIVYGGSFDPPHRAHVELPLEVADGLGADGMLYVPASIPPHKRGRVLVSGDDRIAMLERSLADVDGAADRAAISRIELDRDGPSYTVDTLEGLRTELGEAVELRLLIGADMMAIFYQWRAPQRIIELAEPVVMARPPMTRRNMMATLPADLTCAQREAWAGRIVDTRTINVSSTELRALLAAGEYDAAAVREALSPSVLAYIRERGLYRTA